MINGSNPPIRIERESNEFAVQSITLNQQTINDRFNDLPEVMDSILDPVVSAADRAESAAERAEEAASNALEGVEEIQRELSDIMDTASSVETEVQDMSAMLSEMEDKQNARLIEEREEQKTANGHLSDLFDVVSDMSKTIQRLEQKIDLVNDVVDDLKNSTDDKCQELRTTLRKIAEGV